MNRQDAIQIRQRQLQGEAVSPELLAEAIAVLNSVESMENDLPRRRVSKGPNQAFSGTKRERMRTDNAQVKLLKAELEGQK
ncbi:MAG: hypothetical protein V4730_11850 [Pseudomonadota bacterium]